MGLQIKLLVIGVFLLLTALSFCQAKNSTVKVVGLIHCTDCIKNQSSSSHTSLGVEVFIICKTRKSETKTQGNGAIDEQGKFNVTLSDEITEDPSSIDGCYARLQSNSSASCPIQGAQTASVKIQSNINATKTVMNRPTIIEFSPITCQSAFFWPFPNLTFFASPPPPPPQNLPPLASPVQPPLPPPENSTPSPQPSYDPPAPEIGAPSPPPPRLISGTQPPTPPPTYQNLPNPTFTSPSPPSQAPPPLPVYTKPSPPLPPPPLPVYTNPSPPLPPPQAPPLNNPIQSPTPSPKAPSYTPNQTHPPTPALSPPPQLPKQEKPIPAPPTAGISSPPSRRKPNPIPRAPPIPRLPRTPSVPRKYFNAPKSKSKPPRSA